MTSMEDLQRKIAQALVESAQRYDWQSVSFTYSQLATVGYTQSEVLTRSGEHLSVDDPGRAYLPFRELRKAMFTPTHGTWYSATATAVRGGDFDIDFNYDDKPEWDGEPDTELYIADQERYPRPEAELPDWHPAKKHPGK